MDKNKKKTLAIFGLLCTLIICILLYMIFGDGTEPSENNSIADSYIEQELPDGIPEIMPDKKSESYRDKRNISTEEYFDMLAYNDDISLVSDGLTETENAIEMQENESAAERVFGPVSQEQNSFSETDGAYPSFISETVNHMDPEERLEYDRKRAEMVKDILIGSENTDTGSETEKARNIEKPDKLIIDFGAATDDGIISSLDDINNDNASFDETGIRRPFKCMFVKSQKIHDGERIRVRLLENYEADGVSIPANTHLTAICRIGKRLELSVLSMQMNGIIVPLSLEAYDTDAARVLIRTAGLTADSSGVYHFGCSHIRPYYGEAVKLPYLYFPIIIKDTGCRWQTGDVLPEADFLVLVCGGKWWENDSALLAARSLKQRGKLILLFNHISGGIRLKLPADLEKVPRLFLPDVLRLRAVTHEYALRSGICCIHVPRQTKSDAGNEN